MSKVILAGGSGFIGNILADHFMSKGDEVVIFSRSPQSDYSGVKSIYWDAVTLGEWVKELEGADVLINLTGKSVNCRYNAENKALILSSRINATNILGEALKKVKHPPELWINSASATIYRHAQDHPQDEETGEKGKGFSVEVCEAWEKAFYAYKIEGVRQTALRIAITLGSKGGVFPYYHYLAKYGLGGKQGDGKQYFSWIHEDDLKGIIDFIIEHKEIKDTLNVSSPHAVKNDELMQHFRKAAGMPFGLPATKWMLQIGTWVMRTETELILKSRWVVPGRLLDSGYVFEVPYIDQAIAKCLK